MGKLFIGQSFVYSELLAGFTSLQILCIYLPVKCVCQTGRRDVNQSPAAGKPGKACRPIGLVIPSGDLGGCAGWLTVWLRSGTGGAKRDSMATQTIFIILFLARI